MSTLISRIAPAAAAIAFAASANAGLIGATETFDTDSANWLNASATSFLDWFPSGGPDGSAYASGTFNFVGANAGDTPVILRARSSANSSGNIFFGDYITEGVTELQFSIRHDGPAPVTLFTRFANPNNFPGATAILFTPIASNTWTDISIAIDPSNPAFVTFEGSDFNTIFSNIGRLQFGVSVDSGLAGLDQDIRFDIDNVRLVPTPGPALAGSLVLAGAALRRRRVSR